MKVVSFFLLLLIISLNSFSQKEILGQVRKTVLKVVLYDNENFEGRSKELAIGQYRLDDFNDVASSIRIPKGLAVFLYEHSDEEGGYGMWADWVADLSNLDQMSLNNKASYITVFSAENNGLIWMPATMPGGNLVSGHWERPRANPVPMVGGPIAGRNIIRTVRSQPLSSDADIGYGKLEINLGDHTPWYWPDSKVDFDADGVIVTNAIADINLICPQHRSVGELSALSLPKKSYEVLEGIVVGSGTAYMDFPTSHYTHDFNFSVIPDPAFHYLFGKHITGPGLNGVGYVYADSQEKIEVEWESGLGQNNVLDGVANPATAFNRHGNNFGFFSAGHDSKDVLWNWPADGDRVHVEGLWIWERAHQPVHTEIHPPHFVAVQRKLPVSFILDAAGLPVLRNQPEDKFIGMRVDVFASGDGNPMFNTKGLNPSFNQITDMNRKDYSFLVKTPFSRVAPAGQALHTAVLRCKFMKQKGDNFPAGADPIITILPDNQVRITIPWKTKNISNYAIFARTFVVYWEDVPLSVGASTRKVVEAEKPKLYQVDLLKINLIKKLDGDEYGDFRIFCNVGSNWIFINEFTDQTDGINILSTGLGNANTTNSFSMLKSFKVYIPATTASLNNTIIYENLQMKVMGWEADGIDIFMGHIINQYSRDKEVVNKFWGSHLKYLREQGESDDKVGSFNVLMNPLTLGQENNTGLQTLHAKYTEKTGDSYVTHAVFDIVYRIREIPFSSTNNSRPGNETSPGMIRQ